MPTSLADIAGRVMKRVIDRLHRAEPDAAEVWRRRSDDQVMAAMLRLGDYEEEGQVIIRAEMLRRGLASSIPDHPDIHIYVVRDSSGGMMEIVSVLPMEVVFSHGTVIESIVGRFLAPSHRGGTLTPENFNANPRFADFLHEVIARHGPDEPDLIEEARRQGTG